MSTRQEREAEFYDRMRGELQTGLQSEHHEYVDRFKWYSIIRRGKRFTDRWVEQHCPDKLILDYGCGEGKPAIALAKAGAKVTGIDISPLSIEMCRKLALKEGLADRTSFLVGDCEATGFPDSYFDVVWCAGVLHHLNVERAYREMARVLKPEGAAISIEGLGISPVINLYRKRTPHLRSQDEHPLLRKDVDLAESFFGKVERKYYHLTTLGAVPFRRLPGFGSLLSVLEAVDSVLLRLPFVRWQAWQVVLVLSQPKKETS